MITIFSTLKPWKGEINTIQRNAIQSWKELGCDIVLLGDEDGTKENSKAFGARHIPSIKKNKYGTPLVNSIFDIIQQDEKNEISLYANADIILLGDLLGVAKTAKHFRSNFLVVGERHNAEVKQEIVFDQYWKKRLKKQTNAKPEGKRSRDYFMFSKEFLTEIPPFALGRGRWDSWIVGESLLKKISVIDASKVIRCVHQNHNFNHLPGSKKIKRGSWGEKGPEFNENKSLIAARHPSNKSLRTTATMLNGKSGLVIHDGITND